MNRCIFIYLTVALFCFGSLIPVSAGPAKLVPYVALNQEYSDNILFSSNDEEEDFITALIGGARYSYDAERVKVKLDGELEQLLYWDNTTLNSLDGSASGSWNYQSTERLSFGLAADYLQDSKRGRETNTTGLIQTGDRTIANFSVSSGYRFSETAKGDVTFEYGQAEVDGIIIDEDDEVIRLDFSFSKNLSQTFKNTVGLLNFGYLHQTADYETIDLYRSYVSDVFQLFGGFSHDITELYNVYLQAGVSYADNTEKRRITGVPLPDEDHSRWGGVFLAGLKYDGLYYDVDVRASQDMRPSTGTRGLVQRTSVSLGIDRKVSNDFLITFDTSCYLNQNDRDTGLYGGEDTLTFNIQPGFRYKFLDTFTLTGAYRYTTVDNRERDTTSERNLIYFEIQKEFDL